MLWISRITLAGNNPLYLPGRNFKWPKIKFKVLGLWVSTDLQLSTSLKYDEKMEKARKILSCWKYRQLTLPGKTTVLKSLASCNKASTSFLWNGKGDKIKRNAMINDYCVDGLND